MTPYHRYVPAELAAALLVLVLLVASNRAQAYAWMNRHDYPNCIPCHADPSGAGLLTAYGRAQSGVLLSSDYTGDIEKEPTGFSGFAFGLIDLPEPLLLGAWLRNAYVWNAAGKRLVDDRYLLMRADVAAQLTLGIVRFHGSLGVVTDEADLLSQQAWLTSSADGPNLVSREYWVGVDLAEQTMLLRAGRVALPFGIRNIEHTAWVRSETRTDINQNQQFGVAYAFNGSRLRTEVMALLGNYQVSPDAYRERGYTGYAELHIGPRYSVGASSLLAKAKADLFDGSELLRTANGLFARIAATRLLALSAEADLLTARRDTRETEVGFVGWLQADVEPWQGVHAVLSLESLREPRGGSDAAFGVWVSLWWFFLPHFDVRTDFVHRELGGGDTANTYLVQLHLYL